MISGINDFLLGARGWRIIALSTLMFQIAMAATAAPVAQFGKTEKRLGSLCVGSSVKQYFWIDNTGDTPLRLTKKGQSCGCLTARVPEVIAPGQSDRVEVVFKVERAGSGKYSVMLGSDDPQHSFTELSVSFTGVIDAYVEPNPPKLEGLCVGKSVEVPLRVCAARNGRPFRITEMIPSSDWLSIKNVAELPTGPSRLHSFVLSFSPAEQGRLNETLTIFTDTRRNPVLRIPLRGAVAGPYVIEPELLNVGVVRVGEEIRGSLSIRRADSGGFALSSSDQTGFSAQPEGQANPSSATEPPSRWRINIALPARTAPGPFRVEGVLSAQQGEGSPQQVPILAVGTAVTSP